MFVEREYLKYEEFIPKKNDILVDVGAQFGDYAILCNKYYGAKVFAFEPLSNNIRIIKENLTLNSVMENFNFYPVALGRSNQKIQVAYNSDMMNANGVGKKQLTEVRTLDSYKLNPDILKIDVEGFEVDVLQGAVETINKTHPKIIIETHTQKLKNEVIAFLSERKYSLKYEGRAIENHDKNMDLIQNLFFEY